MHPYLRHKAIIAIILLVSATAAWSIGAREDPLVYADKLIAEQKYDEAILYIAEFMKQYPERFDEGQARLREITRIRSAYNEKAAALLQVLIEQPTNEELKVALIRELEAFERNPSPAIKAFVAQTKDLALFTLNRAKFEDIMARARILIDERRFAEAAKLYATGFELYRPEFLDAGYNELAVSSSLARVEAVGTAISEYEAAGARLEQAFSALSSAFSAGNPSAVASLWPEAEAAALAHAARRRTAVDAGRALETTFAVLTAADETVTENSFLPFAFRLILGRRTESRLEGVAGAMDAQWAYTLGPAQNFMEDAVATAMKTARAAFDAGSWRAAADAFGTAADLAARGLPIVALWGLYAPTELDGRSTALGQAMLESKGPDYLRLSHLAGTARAWSALAALEADLAAGAASLAAYNPSSADRAVAVAGFAARLASFTTADQGVATLRTSSGSRATLMQGWTTAGYGSETSIEIQGAFDAGLAAAGRRALDMQVQTVAKAATYEYQFLARASEAAAAILAQGRGYLEGLPSDDPDLPGTLFYYPSRAIVRLGDADLAFAALQREISAYVASYRNRSPAVATAVPVAEWVARAEALAATTAVRVSESSNLAAAARERKRQADAAKAEAERRVAEARIALKANNFETARQRVDSANELYRDSIEYEQDPTLRVSSDLLVSELRAAILKAENDLVVADTRSLLEQGKDLYLQGFFDGAEGTLLQAQARWRTTNATDDVEVKYWLDLVRTALSVKTGRDIPITAPLYPEMSQLLSLAKKYYDEGVALMNRRDKVGALNAFALAQKKIDEVKIIFPLNQEARVLELRILMVVDPPAGADLFKRLFAEAKAKKEAKQDLATAYSDLKDLEVIDPRYPGLKALIVEVEILIGIRAAPADPKKLAESKTLTAQAQAIYDTRDEKRYDEAKALVARAIVLDPKNQAASILKDLLARATTGTIVTGLTINGEILYNDAVAYFTGGDYINTRVRLNRLYSSEPTARQVQKVADLDARLTALGY